MKKLFILFQWFVVIFGATALCWYLFRPRPVPHYAPESWGSWRGFHALSFEGIVNVEDPRYVSPERLTEQLSALQAAGYETVTDGDVIRFLNGETPLPEKALFLMFEGGRKDHLVRGTPVLHATGYIGHMAVPTAVTDIWGTHYLRSGDVRRLARLPHWQVMSMGHAAVGVEASVRTGDAERFLSQRLPDGESDADFRERVAGDFEEADTLLRRWTGKGVAGYLFPFADSGVGEAADPLAADAIRQALARHHQLAFTTEGDSFNHHTRDPYALTRMRVRGDWSGEELLSRLRANDPSAAVAAGERIWRITGPGRVVGDVLEVEEGVLFARRGAAAWPHVRVSFVPEVAEGGTVDLYLRHTGSRDYVRVRCGPEEVLVQERLGGVTRNLARMGGVPADTRLTVRLKHHRISVEAEGQEGVPATPVQVLSAGNLMFGGGGKGGRVRGGVVEPFEPLQVLLTGLADESEFDAGEVLGAVFPVSLPVTREETRAMVRLVSYGLRLTVDPGPGNLEAFLESWRTNPLLASLVHGVVVGEADEAALTAVVQNGLAPVLVMGGETSMLDRGESVRFWYRDGDLPRAKQAGIAPHRIWVTGTARSEDWPFEMYRVQHVREVVP